MTDNKTGNKASGIGLGRLLIGLGVALIGTLLAGKDDASAQDGAGQGGDGHAAPDLVAGADMGPSHRAPEAFRPDMDAPMTPAEREALRPAVGPPSLSGVSTSQPSGS